MAKGTPRWLDWIAYAGLRVVAMVMHCWPVQANLQVAQWLGDFMYAVDRRHRRRAMANLQRSFPELSEAQIQALARQSMQQLFMLFVEVLFTTRLIRLDTIDRHLQLGRISDVLRMMMPRRRGVIMLTGHYGNWEILGYALATMGFETTSIARPLDNPYINHWLLGVRQKMGQKIIAKKGATDDIVSTLRQHGAVGFIADQNAGPKGVFVDFFGRKASTYKSIALLAMEFEVPVVVGYARRRGCDFRFEMGVQDIIQPDDWRDEPNPVLYITQRYTRAIEDFVRAEPGQYLWVHRRWKTRPRGEAPESYD